MSICWNNWVQLGPRESPSDCVVRCAIFVVGAVKWSELIVERENWSTLESVSEREIRL